MRILMINKFLHYVGGTETYIFKLGDALKAHGHEVQYFGMEHEGRQVGNAVNAYTSTMDFHGGSKLSKIAYPIKVIYSTEARKKIRLVLADFKPDVCHLNIFNFQLTPSIILEIRKWEKKSGHKVKIILTAHDYQLICPNHMLYIPATHEVCEKCIGGHYGNCVKKKCIHGSRARSLVGMLEAKFWNSRGTYKEIDKIICCSQFMKDKMDTNPIFKDKTVTMHNFTDFKPAGIIKKEKYILYFGRFSEEKGIRTLIEVAKKLPEVSFIFAGKGSIEIENLPNVKDVGFKSGDELTKLIQNAYMTVCPSEWYEAFGLNVIESIKCETPVIGTKMGGMPENIEPGINGDLFESGDSEQLSHMIAYYWEHPEIIEEMSKNCSQFEAVSVESYYTQLVEIYRGGGGTAPLCK